MRLSLFTVLFILVLQTSCANNNDTITESQNNEPVLEEAPTEEPKETPTISTNKAKIVSVTTRGSENNYTFNVGISSPDTGCEQFADWWEIITENGTLLSRRILLHSHVNEQPFTRSNSGVTITSDQIVIIRAHMNTLGYGTEVFKGSITSGFSATTISGDFASELATQAPLPSGCAF